MKEKGICLISTPFQLFSLLCAQDQGCFENITLVLVLHGMLRSEHDLIQRLRQSDRFSEVIVAQDSYPVYHHLGIACLYDFAVFPARSKERFYLFFPELQNKQFDYLIASCADRAALEAKRFAVPEGKTLFIDDGEGTHTGFVLYPLACFDENAIEATRGKGIKKTVRYFARKTLNSCIGKKSQLSITKVMTFAQANAELQDLFGNIPVEQIFASNPASINQLLSPNADARAYKYASLIYLSLPGDMAPEVLDKEKALIEEMEKATKGKLHIRLHPRRQADAFSDYRDLILGDAFWEGLILEGTIDSTTTLLALGSTAQSTPYMLSNCEPRCIYLFKLFKGAMADLSPYMQMEENLRHLYKDPSRVMSPERVDDLLLLLQ